MPHLHASSQGTELPDIELWPKRTILPGLAVQPFSLATALSEIPTRTVTFSDHSYDPGTGCR